MAASGFVARLVAMAGIRRVLSAGMMSFGLGLFLLTFISPSGGYFYTVLPGTLFIGLGAALVLVSGSIAATAGIRPEQQGLASGLWNTGPQIGTALGVAIVMAVANTHKRILQGNGEATTVAESALSVNSYQSALAAAIIFAGIGLFSAFFLNRSHSTLKTNVIGADRKRNHPMGAVCKK